MSQNKPGFLSNNTNSAHYILEILIHNHWQNAKKNVSNYKPESFLARDKKIKEFVLISIQELFSKLSWNPTFSATPKQNIVDILIVW